MLVRLDERRGFIQLFLISLVYLRHKVSSVDVAVSIVAVTCDQSGLFHCDDFNNECVDKSLVCNGVSECSTGKDESVEECGCHKWEFQCNATVCIDLIRRCDKVPDCADGLDEQNCELYQCPSTHSKCKNHLCIPRDKSCDFYDDCGDNSDEENCDYGECYDTQFTCNNSQCITMGMLCDGVADCIDQSDEINCDSYFQCSNQLRLLNSKVCDGWVDCVGDQKDEINCRQCYGNEYRCKNGRCIKKSNVCDGVCDCGGTCDDEDHCDSIECPMGDSYICKNSIDDERRCIEKQYLCDNHNDCLNTNIGADEFFCWNTNNSCSDFHEPYTKMFVCPEGRCLPASGPDNVVCDYWNDCLNGEDEMGCDFENCSSAEFRCKNGQCIGNVLRCDGQFDCLDRTDEVNCESWACLADQFKCGGGQCIPGEFRCDYYRDCPDGTDEKTCEKHPNRRQCTDNEFRCDNGQCISRDLICYKGKNVGRLGCADWSHMLNCSGWNCTKKSQFKCRNSYCIDEEQVCDNIADCRNTYEDEFGCPYTCPYKVDVCMCKASLFDCSNRGLTALPHYLNVETGLTDFNLTGNYLSLTMNTFKDYDILVHLDLSNNSIETLPPAAFSSLWRLVSLSLEHNIIRMIKNGTFIGLTNLRSIYLADNLIEKIEPYAFTGLSRLPTLDLSFQHIYMIERSTFVGLRSLFTLNLSKNKIQHITDGAFNGLPALLTLDISDNQINSIEPNIFHGLPKLRMLFTDGFQFCCLAKSIEKCLPEPDEFSSCEDLMSNYFLRASIWILGIIGFLGNLLVFAWRVRDLQNGKVHSFLISNLALADFFMGVYLLIIASVDSYYRGNYFIYDKQWRESSLCKFAGCISTFSSELSVFTLTVITFDRLICIIFPLKLKRLGMKEAVIVMPFLWIVVFAISTVPLLEMQYFHNFYGRSGVCLALHITPEKPKGWEYSVFVFLALNFVSFLLIFLSYLWMFLVAKKTTTAVRKSKAKSDKSMAKRMTLIVMTDFCCWIPIILLGFVSLGGISVPQQVYAWVAVFVLPLNSAINPILYTISTAPFMRNIRKRASRFRKSFTGSFRTSFTKHSYLDERTQNSETWNRNSMYRQLELMRLRGLKKTYSYSTHRAPPPPPADKLSRM